MPFDFFLSGVITVAIGMAVSLQQVRFLCTFSACNANTQNDAMTETF